MRRIIVIALLSFSTAATEAVAADTTAAATGDGAAQFPLLLAGYHARPPWKVAGVDYAVGVPAATVLRQPGTISIRGTVADPANHMLRVTGADVSLNGIDFSRDGGWSVQMVGARNTRIENCLFTVGQNHLVPIYADPATVDLTVAHSTVDGGADIHGRAEDVWTLISYSGSGRLVIEYNWLKNAPQHVVEFKDGTLIYRANLVHNIGYFKGAHVNFVQFNGSQSDGSAISYNTMFNPQPGPGAPISAGEIIQVEAQLGSSISNVEVDHNTVIAQGPRLVASYLIAVRQDPGNRIDRVSVHDNYLDWGGAYGPYYAPTGTNITYMNDRDLRSGAILGAPRPTQ